MFKLMGKKIITILRKKNQTNYSTYPIHVEYNLSCGADI